MVRSTQLVRVRRFLVHFRRHSSYLNQLHALLSQSCAPRYENVLRHESLQGPQQYKVKVVLLADMSRDEPLKTNEKLL